MYRRINERYSFENVKELFHALNNDILKKELYEHMIEDLHAGIPTYPILWKPARP